MNAAEKRLFNEMLYALERAECRFDMCPGPDKPVKNMCTCVVCAAIRHARNYKKREEKTP